MAADTDHFDALDSLADTHQKKLAESLVTLENRIADLVATAPLQDGKLFDLEWAVNARNELRQAINEDYLTEVDSIIRDYDQVAVDAATMLGEYGDIVQLDQDVIGQLQQMTFQGFEDLGAEHLDIISKQVYESTLTGATFANSVNAVREGVGKDMARYASQQVHDSLMQFDRAVNTKIALDSGAEKFKYRGSDDSKTRSFCARHVDKVYTIDEINEIWQGEWTGKSSSNAFATAGGYNCRHRFRPVFDDVVEDQQVDEPVATDDSLEGVPKQQSRVNAEKEINKKIKPKYQDLQSGEVGDDYFAYPRVDGKESVRYRRGTYNARKHGRDWTEYSRKGFGSIEHEFSDELSSVMVTVLDETAQLSAKYKVPQIRGLDLENKAVASMGDGVLALNPRYLDKRAKAVFVSPDKRRKALDKTENLEKKRRNQQQVVDKLRKERDDLEDLWIKAEMSDAPQDEVRALSNKVFAADTEVRNAGVELRKLNNAIQEQREIAGVGQVSNWKFGDDPDLRPFTAEKYFIDPLDNVRQTIYHEYGHTVHQEYNRVAKVFSNEMPDIEKILKKLNRKRDKMQATKYMAKNGKEWWAESFSLHNLGRKDLVDPRMSALIEAIEESPVRLTLDEMQSVVDKADKEMKSKKRKK